MNIRTHENGRISFPGIIEYRVGNEILPYPPTYDSHPAAPTPVPLASRQTAKMIAMGEINPIPNSLPYSVIELDLKECRKLAASGLLYDPRHTGHAYKKAADSLVTA